MINYCLLLGFEGRYRVLDNGRTQLETIKQRLWQMIRGVRGSYPPPLSPPGRSPRSAQALAADDPTLGVRGAGRFYRLPVLYRAELASG